MAIAFASSLRRSSSAAAVCFATAMAVPVHGQGMARTNISSPSVGQDGSDIVVTAQKREERLQDVGLSVTAIGGDALANRRISTAADLAQAVPGLIYTQSQTGSTVYTLRGVGFFESTIAAYPDVSTYIDQVPLPLPQTSTLTAFDLERVEVLKGPQGTLFGNNATGGAINFIAAKPDDRFGAGATLSYGRFNTVDVSGYITGPISDTLTARLAAKAVKGDDWQKSYTRKDSTGATNSVAARFLLDWTPSDRLSLALNVNGWRDRSDPTSPQIYARVPQNPVGSAGLGGVITADLPIYVYPLAPHRPRATDFTPDKRPRANNSLWQTALRADYEVTDGMAFTSLTSYLKTRIDSRIEYDGTILPAYDIEDQTGSIKSFSQELRLASSGPGPLRWVLGGNIEITDVFETQLLVSSASSSAALNGFGQARYTTSQKMRNYAAFANIEYELLDGLTAKGGLRYTRAKRSALIKNVEDPNFDDGLSVGVTNFFNMVWGSLDFIYPNFRPINVGESFFIDNRLNADGTPFDPATYGTAFDYRDRLNENSTSWRLGLDYKVNPDLLLYANVSKGYKAGSFPTSAAATFTQLAPVVQESLLDYEVGFKAQFANRTVTLNGAAFYYDYRDKQLRAKIVDGIFGLLDGLVNVPKSTVKGAELELMVRPRGGFTFGVAATWLDAKVKQYEGIVDADVDAVTGLRIPVRQSYKGVRLPFSPRWQVSANVEYTAPVSENLNAILGLDMSAQTASSGVLALTAADRTNFRIPGRAIFGGNIGVGSQDGRWRATLWGRNIFNKYYIINTLQVYDAVNRYAGRPAEYGLSVTIKY